MPIATQIVLLWLLFAATHMALTGVHGVRRWDDLQRLEGGARLVFVISRG